MGELIYLQPHIKNKKMYSGLMSILSGANRERSITEKKRVDDIEFYYGDNNKWLEETEKPMFKWHTTVYIDFVDVLFIIAIGTVLLFTNV